MSSTKEPKTAKCIFSNVKFSKDQRDGTWTQGFSCFQLAHLDCTGAKIMLVNLCCCYLFHLILNKARPSPEDHSPIENHTPSLDFPR
ncbi:hypothetical protein TNCV_2166681 [Trichonephila clavipes]|nr:hypothetical protein TNCV_2166681 [Trichonephila clavipes]